MCSFKIFILFLVIGIVWDFFAESEGLVGFLGFFIGIIFAAAVAESDPEVIFDHNQSIEIYSSGGDYNQISGQFSIFSGILDSKEQYAVTVKNGEYFDRLYIPVVNTHRIVNRDLDGTAIYTERTCVYKWTILGFPCHQEMKQCPEKNILEVPEGAIIKSMNFNWSYPWAFLAHGIVFFMRNFATQNFFQN